MWSILALYRSPVPDVATLSRRDRIALFAGDVRRWVASRTADSKWEAYARPALGDSARDHGPDVDG